VLALAVEDGLTCRFGEDWWGKQDSNLRRLSQRIYSPPPLPLGTFPLRQREATAGKDFPFRARTRYG
jgi:hypothetical protein